MNDIINDFDLEKTKIILEQYSLANGVGLSLLDSAAIPVFHTLPKSCLCNYCSFLNKSLNLGVDCRRTYLYGSLQSSRFGGRHVYFCQTGLAHFVSPIIRNGKISATIISEPILLIDKAEYLETDVITKYAPDDETIKELNILLSDVKYIPPNRVHALSEQLFVNVSYFSKDATSQMETVHETNQLQSAISEYIASMKKSEHTDAVYPFDKEAALLDMMIKGEKKEAKALLNEILGQIFFYSGYRLEVIKSRVIELVALLSRAAVKGGADMELVLGLNFNYLKEVDQINTIDDLSYWLSVVMNRFMNYVFHLSDVKHADVIHKSFGYVKDNYMNKLTLEDVAQFVYLSPPYFSKIFKFETGETFNAYLNKVRVEHSKKLLLKSSVNLSDISTMVGYEDQSYFTKVFKKMTGLSPGKYRQSRGMNYSATNSGVTI